MIEKGKGVMSWGTEQELKIGPEYYEEEMETSHGKVRVIKQVPESDSGVYDPETKTLTRFHREEVKQAA